MPMPFPTEIYDAIVFYIVFPGDEFEVQSRRYKTLGSESRQTLATLRLVNKSFCSSSTPQLFRYIVATVGDSQRLSPLVRLRELSNSPYATYIHQIDIGFQHEMIDINQTYMEDFAGLLPICLAKLPNLHAVEFHGPSSSIPQEKTNLFVNTVIAALRYATLSNLKELEIKLPITYHFRQLFCSNASSLRTPIEDVLRGLQHLGLHVTAYTSDLGQRYFHIPVSLENFAFPNETYAIHLFRLVNLAVNLDSLTICSTDVLNLDDVQFSSLLRLKFLYLSKVAISSRTLLSLVEQCRESIESVQLFLVQLSSGTWQTILSQMSTLPHLFDFYIESSGYSLTGTSSHLDPGILPPCDDPKSIETMESLDIYALGNLQRHVNVNRAAAGRTKLSGYEYRHIQLQTLESRIEELGLDV